MRSPRLASVFALRLAVVLGLAMVAYAAVEISRDPAVSRWELAATRAWHVAALGLLLYATLLVGFERTIAARRMRLGPGEPEAQRVARALRDAACRIGATSPEDAAVVLAGAAALESARALPPGTRQLPRPGVPHSADQIP